MLLTSHLRCTDLDVQSSARLDPRDTPSRPHILLWVRNLFSARPSSAEIELRECHSGVVDVPHCQAQRRNASAREQRRPAPLKPKKPAASTSRPPNINVTQQSTSAAQAQTSSQAQAAVSTSSAALPVTNTTSHTNPRATIENADRWTRFWLFVCCTTPEYTRDHH
ncbi:hypothetical protein BDR03DRAFT_964849 [Suillus americanus]|nr:hypothetical protein BDR03DRAFT_964849 [Suillus americanus]